MKRILPVRLAVLALAVLAVTGCGGGVSGTKLNGKVLNNGQPYPITEEETVRINFITTGESGRISAQPQLNPDGTFTLTGPTGKGVPPGKYQITVMVLPSPYAASKNPGAPKGDKFKNKYADPEKTPLTVEITSSTKEVTVDLGKGTATAA